MDSVSIAVARYEGERGRGGRRGESDRVRG